MTKFIIINRVLLTLILFISVFNTSIVTAQAKTRACVVQDSINTGGYTFILCQESNDIWLAAPKIHLAPGERILWNFRKLVAT